MVIESHHADYDVLVRVGGNVGRVVGGQWSEGLIQSVADAMCRDKTGFELKDNAVKHDRSEYVRLAEAAIRALMKYEEPK